MVAQNQVGQQNHDTNFIACYVVFTLLSTICIALRFFSRRVKRAPYFLEDYLVLFAWFINMGEATMIVAATNYAGMGYHAAILSKSQLISYAKVFYAAGYLHGTCLAMAKLSILLQLKRIFILKWFTVSIYILCVIVVLWWIASVLTYALICLPIASNWDPTIPHHCGNNHLSIILDPLPWIITDFVILLLPMPVLRTLHLSTGKKIGLVAIFLTGGLTCIVACVRYQTLFTINPIDPTWSVAATATWNIVETNVSVICACIIIIQPALKRLFMQGFVYNSWSRLQTRLKSSEVLSRAGSDSKPVRTRSHSQQAPSTPEAQSSWEEYSIQGHSVPLSGLKSPHELKSYV